MTVMQNAVKHGSDGSHVTQQFAPVFHRSIRRQQGAGALVAPHHDLQQVLRRGERQLAHAEVVDDQQRHGGQRLHVLFARAIHDGLGQFVEQYVGFAI